MTCLSGLAVVGRSVAAPGSALEADPAIPVPSKAMATATTRALQYRRTRRLGTVAGMVPSLGFDLADTPGFRVVVSQDRPFGRLGQRQIALRVGQETIETASRLRRDVETRCFACTKAHLASTDCSPHDELTRTRGKRYLQCCRSPLALVRSSPARMEEPVRIDQCNSIRDFRLMA